MIKNFISTKVKVTYGMAFIIAAIGLLFPIDYNVYWDQCVYLLHSKYFAGLEIGYSELLFRSPLLSFISAPLWSLTSKIIYFKLLSFVFTLLFIFSVFKYIEVISSKKKAIIVSVFLATFGIIQIESKFFLTDIPALAFMFGCLWIVHTNNKRKFFIAGLLFGLTITMRLGYLYFTPVMAFYFIYNMKNKRSQIIESLLGFFAVYGVYNTWIYTEFETIFGNISRARFEGQWVASYSFEKIYQVFNVTGISIIILSLLNIFNQKVRSWIWPISFILVVFIIIPYNPQNDRFIIPAVPLLLYLSINFLDSLKNKKVFLLLFTLMLTEHSFLILKNRSLLSLNSKQQPSIARRIGLLIKSMPFDTIYTNSFYPSLAFYSEKEVIVPHIVGHDKNEFHFVDHTFLTKPGIVVANNLGPMNTNYFKPRKENFSFIMSVDNFDLYEYLGNFSKSIKQYRLHILEAPGNLYAHGKGFLELDRGNISKFQLQYNISENFLEQTKTRNCILEDQLSFSLISNTERRELRVLSNNKSSVWIKFSPNKINGCPIFGKSFKLRFDLINNKDRYE
jgi:hypothetical protein